jgi:hypothetical protein
MCHLVRDYTAAAAAGDSAALPRDAGGPRVRWAGAVLAALLGGFALAALDAPRPPAPAVQARDPAGAIPYAARSSIVPPAPLDQGMLPVDDGVPTAADMNRARAGDCHHGL